MPSDSPMSLRAAAAGLVPASVPDDVPPPGDTLSLRLEELGMTQAELALRTGLTTKHVSQLMNGLVPLTAEVAQRLDYATAVPARWWNRLEADFRSARTAAEQEAAAASYGDWAKSMPVRHLVRVGALPTGPTDWASRARQLLTFFGVASPDAYAALWARPAAAFRQSAAYAVDDGAVAAWLRLGELAADAAPASTYDVERLRSSLPELRQMTTLPLLTAWPEARDLLADAGVVVVLVPEVTGARAYGATRWRGARPLVQLSLRGRSDDAFWITLLHELGHVLLHGRRSSFVEFADDGDDVDTAVFPDHIDAEAQATRFALDQLFGHLDEGLLERVHDEDDVATLAAEIGIGPGLLVARMHALGLWDRSRGSRLRRRTPALADLTTAEPVVVRPRPRRRVRSHDDGREGQP